MKTCSFLLLGLSALLLHDGAAGAAEPPKEPTARDVRALAEKIDQHLAKHWAGAKVEPAPPADDAEFLRRVYLDVAGRIPTAAEARAFLDDKGPDKRTRLVNQLLDGPRYATHFTNVWRAILIPEASNNFLVQAQQTAFEEWLKQQLTRNVPYDRMV